MNHENREVLAILCKQRFVLAFGRAVNKMAAIVCLSVDGDYLEQTGHIVTEAGYVRLVGKCTQKLQKSVQSEFISKSLLDLSVSLNFSVPDQLYEEDVYARSLS